MHKEGLYEDNGLNPSSSALVILQLRQHFIDGAPDQVADAPHLHQCLLFVGLLPCIAAVGQPVDIKGAFYACAHEHT